MKHRSPFRGLALALLILMVIPATRELILTAVVSVALFVVGGLLMLLVVCNNRPRRR